MAVTTVLGLRNDLAASEVLTAAEVNAHANNMEWIAAGFVSKSVAGSSNVTLTEAEYETRYIILTGVLTGNINVIFPTHAGREWTVLNNTSGAFTVTVKTAAGAGIAVPQGSVFPLACDGTDIKMGGAGVANSRPTYAITNVTTDRTLDANATTLDELADAFGTLVSDLRAAGLVL